MLLAAAALVVLHYVQPKFKYPWMVAAGGAFLALIAIFLWQVRFPQSASLGPWQPVTIFLYVPVWMADGTSWPYALALGALALAVILTSVVRNETESMPWAGTLTLCALGLLAVSAGNPLTLVLAWSIIDLAEVLIMIRSTEGESQSQSVIVAFAVRLGGTGLLLWANSASIAAGSPLVFNSIPANVGLYLLVAAGLRLGVLPLHLPYQKENVVRRGFGTSLRLVSAAASLILLARIPAASLKSSITPYLLILAGVTALYAAWMWVRSSDEILGRPFWVLSLASLAVAESLRGNPTGSIGWGVAAILSGGMIFLFSARQRQILWVPLLGLWGLSTLPFSLNASAWQAGSGTSWLFLLPLLLAQAFLMTGFLRHCLHPGETSLESQEKWARLLYPTGLLLLAGSSILLGVWGWTGARTVGAWVWAILAALLAGGSAFLAQRYLPRLSLGAISGQWLQILPLRRVYRWLYSLYTFFVRIANILTSTLEGDGGLLWSFLILVLIISILSTRGQ